MVKSVLGVNHQGLRDWFIQRVSAAVMAIYTVGMVSFFLLHRDLDFATWHALFAHTSIKVVTLVVVGALLWHAWIGIWTIVTDYIKVKWLSLLVIVAVFFILAASFFWTLMILWGI
jgi:succinate dehydrogenase / fumarate reductase membrane anchor subunit